MTSLLDLDDSEARDVPLVRRARTDDAEMDITPMIDVTFLLLIFFLVCSSPDQQNSVDLPKARYGTGVDKKNSVVITVSDEGI